MGPLDRPVGFQLPRAYDVNTDSNAFGQCFRVGDLNGVARHQGDYVDDPQITRPADGHPR